MGHIEFEDLLKRARVACASVPGIHAGWDYIKFAEWILRYRLRPPVPREEVEETIVKIVKDPEVVKMLVTPWSEARAGYLATLSDGEDHNFSEYDNVELLFSMVDSGIVEFSPEKKSVHQGLGTSLWLRLKRAAV